MLKYKSTELKKSVKMPESMKRSSKEIELLIESANGMKRDQKSQDNSCPRETETWQRVLLNT